MLTVTLMHSVPCIVHGCTFALCGKWWVKGSGGVYCLVFVLFRGMDFFVVVCVGLIAWFVCLLVFLVL